MDKLLTPISAKSKKKDNDEEPLFKLSSSVSLRPSVSQQKPISVVEDVTNISSPDQALEILKSQPEYTQVVNVLKYLKSLPAIPDVIHSQISHILASEIAQNYWPLFNKSSVTTNLGADGQLLIVSLTSLPGVNALITQLRTFITEAKVEKDSPQRPGLKLNFGTLLDILSVLLRPESFIADFWQRVSKTSTSTKRRLLSQQMTSLFGGGQILQVAAEADMLAQHGRESASWVGSGKLYSEWIAKNMVSWQRQGTGDDGKLCADIFSRSLNLGYQDTILQVVFERMILSTNSKSAEFRTLFSSLSNLDQKRIFDKLLIYLANTRLAGIDPELTAKNPKISAVVKVLRDLLDLNQARLDILINWLTGSTGAGLGHGVSIRRACVAALSSNRDAICQVLEKSVIQFGDKLYIQHAPIMQQECHAQILLLAAGYIHRNMGIKLKTMLRILPYPHLVSNRLSASHRRVRILGMVIGEAISGLVDDQETLNFHMNETNFEDTAWLKKLVKVNDESGKPDPILKAPSDSTTAIPQPTPPKPKPRTKKQKPTETSKVKPIIKEVTSESDNDDDDDVTPYAKPDSDPEDSEDDATLINHHKLTAPVYIRTLIGYLRDDESYDKQKTGLTTAAILIRRKANYGTEVTDHTEELATILVSLQDKYDIEDFHNMRLNALSALVIAQPKITGPLLARSVFGGDYSLAQRVAILSAIGMGVRELAGIDNPVLPDAAKFPSKCLPERMEKLYLTDDAGPAYLSPSTHSSKIQNAPGSHLKALPTTALDTIAHQMTTEFLAPIAAAAADSTTGPDALKIITLKSHITRQNPPRSTVRSIPNTTASLISTHFFFPLTAHFQHSLHARASLVPSEPLMLSTAVKTLAILIYSAGPSTLALPQMTSEFWGLLLALRAPAARHISVAGAILTGMLAMLVVNENRMRDVCVELGRQVVESQEWAGVVFGNTRGGEGEGAAEENEVKMMAAAVLVKLDEAIKAHQALLMGNLLG